MTEARIQRLFNIVPGAASWMMLLLPIVFSITFPEIVALFYSIFCLFWLFRALSYSYHLLRSYFIFKKVQKVAWQGNGALEHKEAIKLCKALALPTPARATTLSSTEVEHIVIVATYKEPYEVVDETIGSVAASKCNLKKIALILATEERDSENAKIIAAKLEKKYGPKFGSFYVTEHPKNLAGEIPGKGGNITFALKAYVADKLSQYNQEQINNMVVTTLDADNKVHSLYFSVLSFVYAHTVDRINCSFQPLPFLYNNIWDIPILNRVVALSSTFWHLIESGRADKIRNFSSHAQPLAALINMNYWATNTIVEDGHQFWRSYLHFDGEYRVVPLFIPVYQDAVQNAKYFTTLWAQYKQLRRWAYGAEDISFTLINFWKKRDKLPKGRSLYHFLTLFEGHLMWTSAPLLLTLSGYIYLWTNPSFMQSAMYFNLSIILSLFFTVSLSGIFVSIWISCLTLPPIPKVHGIKKIYLFTSIFFQWMLLPITTIVFSALPALEAQTRLMFGNKMGFEVTQKIRK